MATHTTTPLYPLGSEPGVDADASADPEILGFGARGDSAEPRGPAEAQLRQLLQLAPPPAQMAVLGGGVAALLVGGAVGYWLGSRRARRPVRTVRHASHTLGAAVGLVPIAMRLLANPLVRAAVLRAVTRQIARRAAA